MKAILIGAVESTRIALECLAQAPEWDLSAVLTLPPELDARHSDFVDLRSDAASAGAQFVPVSNINSEDALASISAAAPDYIFVIGWSQLCGPRFMSSARRGVIGYHPAPLPRLRGRGVIPWTILLEEPITASTLFRIDEGTDSGPILAQRFFHVAPDETAASLYANHMTALRTMLPTVLHNLAQGTAIETMQDERHATFAARRRPEDGRIDWSEPAKDVWRIVRACGDPYPGAWTFLGSDRIVIAAAHLVPLGQHRAAMPGQVVERTAESFTVKCGGDEGLHVSQWRRTKDGPPPLHAILGRTDAMP